MPLRHLVHVPASSLHVSKPVWWLTSRFHFSFADYWDEKRLSFGVLRVLNDDIVAVGGGFPPHPHRDMEIVSYVVDGHLSHEHRGVDGSTAKESLPRGSIQYMSAGRGVRHSEMNDDPAAAVRFLQLWITPDARGYAPNYGSRRFDAADRKDKLLRVVSGQSHADDLTSPSDGSVPIHQDAQIFVSELSRKGSSVPFPLREGRQAYLVCVEGSVTVRVDAAEALTLTERDAVRITGPTPTLTVEAAAEASAGGGKPAGHVLIVEMPQSSSFGSTSGGDSDLD